MEHSSWENWPLIHTEMGHDDDGDFLEQCHTDDDDFLRDILQQPDFSSESETQSFHHPPPPPIVHNNNNFTASATEGSSISSDETDRPAGKSRPHHGPSSCNSPRTFILSFDNSTIIPATAEQPYLGFQQLGGTTTTRSSKSSSSPVLSSKKRALDSNNDHQNLEPKPSRATSQGGKKSRNDSQTRDHIMAERKRRQELTERFIALSATIPGLKKTDKASILGEAIKYLKQLQERVIELEKRKKRSGTDQSMKSAPEDTTISSERSGGDDDDNDQDYCYCKPPSELLLPDVEARVLEKEVLIEIHCKKANGIELKILDHIENLHLTVTGSSVLPFGNSTLGITIIAQMGDAYRMTVNDLVTNLREVLLNGVHYY